MICKLSSRESLCQELGQEISLNITVCLFFCKLVDTRQYISIVIVMSVELVLFVQVPTSL